MARGRHRSSWLCWLFEHDFVWDAPASWAAHCRRCGEGWDEQ